VAGSYSTYYRRLKRRKNPTDGVGGWFILDLLQEAETQKESHRQSGWLVHARPTTGGGSAERIPPTESVDGS
jgi:hypothetical protein